MYEKSKKFFLSTPVSIYDIYIMLTFVIWF